MYILNLQGKGKIIYIIHIAGHFHVGGDNYKVEGGGGDPAKPVYKTKPYLTFTLTFSFLKPISQGENAISDRQFAQCPAAVECLV